MTRQEYNREIIKQISEYIEANPDIRFIQTLWNMGIITSNGLNETTDKHDIVDKYNEESYHILNKLK
jgi:hypothetical protein